MRRERSHVRGRIRPWERALKRPGDVLISLAALVVLVPLLAVIAVAIKLDSPGPILYRQTRIGRNGRHFQILKFRKMHHGLPAQGPMLTCRDDPRLTRVGRVLERTKLDELPQFLNVLTGDMSLVGPRPEVPRFIVHYPELWDTVLMARPGIFSAGSDRNESDLYPPGVTDLEAYYVGNMLELKLESEAAYVQNIRFTHDFSLFVRGALSVVWGGRKEAADGQPTSVPDPAVPLAKLSD